MFSSMSSLHTDREPVHISVRNIGGIDATTIELTPGVTALTGRNATNRTSLLQAIMAALGSDHTSLKGDADEGSVELIVGEHTYTRTLTRTNGDVVTDGDPYLEDAELADLFAFLLESNDARRAVARSDDLRDLIMRPVDTEAIHTDIDQLESEKRELDDQLESLQSLEQQLPNLEQQRTQLTNQIEAKHEELTAKQDELDAADMDVEETRDEKDEFNEKLDELREVRNSLENTRHNLDTERESIEALREEKQELENDREALPETPVGDIDELDARIDQYRDELQTLDTTINELQTIIQFNEDMLEGTSPEIRTALRDDTDESTSSRQQDRNSITDQLVEDDDTVVCWTCGSDIQPQQIEATLDRLRDLRQENLDERNTLQSKIDDLQAEKRDLETQHQQRERLQRRLQETDAEIEERTESVEELEEQRDDLIAEVEQLEDEIEELETEEYSEILDLHKEVNQAEFELDRLRSDRDDIDDEIESIERQLDERNEIKAQRQDVQSDLEDLRTRIDQIEAQAVDQFNTHMETVLDLLDYANLERIWIDRTEREEREGRRTVTRQIFDLHVVRRAESGEAYEDTIDHLSESEREVTGLVFALAGYLVHDVHEEMPFMLLDSLEAIDAERIGQLIEYFADYATYMIVALLPEDATALDGEHQRITEI